MKSLSFYKKAAMQSYNGTRGLIALVELAKQLKHEQTIVIRKHENLVELQRIVELKREAIAGWLDNGLK